MNLTKDVSKKIHWNHACHRRFFLENLRLNYLKTIYIFSLYLLGEVSTHAFMFGRLKIYWHGYGWVNGERGTYILYKNAGRQGGETEMENEIIYALQWVGTCYSPESWGEGASAKLRCALTYMVPYWLWA